MQDKIDERVRRIVATLFEVDEASVGPQSSPSDLPKWTSMGHLLLMLEIEQSFGIQLSPERMAAADSVGAVVECLRDAGAGPES